MKFDINNPAFLQSGGNQHFDRKIVMLFSSEENKFRITTEDNSDVIVEYYRDGEPQTNSVTPVFGGNTFFSDIATPIIFKGKIKSINAVSQNSFEMLESLGIYRMGTLSEVNLGEETKLLNEITIQGSYPYDVQMGIGGAMSADPEIDGVLICKGSEASNLETLIEKAIDCGWTVEYQ